ncbi:MAG TPA: 5-(carboxyamino)imidazole ribonucleotide mutase, partial [bacterium]|nr:5-(carboxyamino)imidazole ribonucleotide mutase [bacterium]
MANAKVLVVMGSSSDFPVMEESRKLLNELGIECRMSIASAHRTPAKVEKLASSAASDGVKVIIAGAGYAAHLAGNLAAHTILPIIGVPLEGSSLGGLDSLIATVQMPGGVPVATVTIGKTGAKNAA